MIFIFHIQKRAESKMHSALFAITGFEGISLYSESLAAKYPCFILSILAHLLQNIKFSFRVFIVNLRY